MLAVIAFVASFGLGLLVGRWSVVGLVVVGWGVFYVGLAAAWWGDGLGETWALAMIVLMGVSAAGAWAGVAVRRVRQRRVVRAVPAAPRVQR